MKNSFATLFNSLSPETAKKSTLHDLGNEPGFRRLERDEIVEEGDETFGVLGQQWTSANIYQVGRLSKDVGGFTLWRRSVGI